MNWIKAKKKSCESENPDFLDEPERNPNNRYFIPRHFTSARTTVGLTFGHFC